MSRDRSFPEPKEARREAIRACGETVRDWPDGFGYRAPGASGPNGGGIIQWDSFVDGIASVAD